MPGSCQILFMMFPDPMFPKLVEACNKSDSIAHRAQRMVDDGALVSATARGLTITWHLTDAALDLIYEAEGAGDVYDATAIKKPPATR